jgi:DNA-binding NarL/FixJ family response regulator
VIRVLVVDDSISFLAAATEVVSAAAGFELEGAAQSGEEAIELARVSRPDLALLDFNMPGLNGEETAERLASESPETVTVVMTATPDATGRSHGLFDKRKLSPATLREIWEQAQAPDAR